jgi:hypothetical protein
MDITDSLRITRCVETKHAARRLKTIKKIINRLARWLGGRKGCSEFRFGSIRIFGWRI